MKFIIYCINYSGNFEELIKDFNYTIRQIGINIILANKDPSVSLLEEKCQRRIRPTTTRWSICTLRLMSIKFSFIFFMLSMHTESVVRLERVKADG